MIDVQRLSFHYGPAPLLKDISFQLEPGQRLWVAGPAQSGKTTLLEILAGLKKGFSGEVHIEGDATLIHNDGAMSTYRTHHMGIALDGGEVLNSLSVAENLHMRALITGQDHESGELLGDLDLGHTGKLAAAQLSHTERHRLSLAIALLTRPKLLLLDDPLKGLEGPVLETMRARIQGWSHGVVVMTGASEYEDLSTARLQLGKVS